jgi:hypothetical protein
MITRKSIYVQIETAWTNTTFVLLALAVLFAVLRFCYFDLGDLAVQLAVLNDPWKQEVESYCVQHVPGCQKVSFTVEHQSTETSRSAWQWAGSRLEVSVTSKAGTEQSVRQALVKHVGDWAADHIAIYVTDGKPTK